MATAAGHEVISLKSDLKDRIALRHEVARVSPEAVVHLAAISFIGHADDSAFYAVNVVGTTNLLAALAELVSPPEKVLLASSANVYGNCNTTPISESQPPAPINHYATSKLGMEHMALTFSSKLRIVITRPFNYTGPGQNVSFVIPKMVAHFAQRKPSISLGNLNVEREFNDVKMVCSAYLLLLEHGEPGKTYNVCSGQTHTLQDVISMLTDLTGHRIDVERSLEFVRSNEVHRLCGSPVKLQTLMAAHGETLHHPSLKDTLQRMLGAPSTKGL